jgi:osmoprotectant transport system permease protein
VIASATSLGGMWSYISGHMGGATGVIDRIGQHAVYSAEALLIASLVAVPLGLWAGHTGHGGTALTLLSNASRALPTLGLVVIFAIMIGVGLSAAIIPLVFIGIPSILVNTYVALRGVDRSLVDAATGMGLTSWQVLWRVKVPVGLPIIFLGLRVAALQIVSTATIAAYVGLGGLGRYVIDGLATGNFAEVGAGAVLVAGFAIVTEIAFLGAARLLVSPGVRRS